MSEPFFSRWSQRKQAVAKGAVVPEPAQAAPAPLKAHTPPEPPPSGSMAAGSTTEKQPAPALPTLQDTQALTPSSDFQPFMQQGVASDVRNAAVKKLFADPHFNVMDGLDIYIGDYSIPDPLPTGMLEKMVGAQLLGLFSKPEEAASDVPPTQRALENPDESPAPPQSSALVAQSPPMPQDLAAQPPSPSKHDDHPDLQLQPNHAPAGPRTGPGPG